MTECILTEDHEQEESYSSESTVWFLGELCKNKFATGVNKSNLVVCRDPANKTSPLNGKSNILNASLINIRSVHSKRSEIQQYIYEKDLDLLFITETWIKDS